MSKTNEFIANAKKKHGDKYDYSKSKYTGYHNKIEIICPCHGTFFKIAHLHLKGSGCNKCNKFYTPMSTTSFIIKAKEKHGDKYDYSKSKYTGANKKVEIICPYHGVFHQDGFRHLLGSGCKQCSINKSKLSTNEFILKAKEKHGDKYDYSKSAYITGKTKIKVICPKHGIFLQLAESHLQGIGCPICSNIKVIKISKSEKEWLRQLNITEYQKTVKCKNKRFIVDGFDYKSNTVYEFYGDFWHGNPKKFNKDDVNIKTKSTFGELYRKTLEKEKMLINEGFKVISIWESDWRAQNENKSK